MLYNIYKSYVSTCQSCLPLRREGNRGLTTVEGEIICYLDNIQY